MGLYSPRGCKFYFGILLVFISCILVGHYYLKNEIQYELTTLRGKENLGSITKCKIPDEELHGQREICNIYRYCSMYSESNPLVRAECFDVTQPKLGLSYQVCVHDKKVDFWVTGAHFAKGKPYEPSLTMEIITALRTLRKATQETGKPVTDVGFIDVGANIGTHTLPALVDGFPTVSVEPLPANVRRLHKSAVLNGVRSRLQIVMNPISNVRESLTMYSYEKKQSGNTFYKKYASGHKFSVRMKSESILADDLQEAISFKSAVMKVDIECLETEFFSMAEGLFQVIDIPVVIMEWNQICIRARKDFPDRVANFFLKLNYTAMKSFQSGEELKISDKLRWPPNIVWSNTFLKNKQSK